MINFQGKPHIYNFSTKAEACKLWQCSLGSGLRWFLVNIRYPLPLGNFYKCHLEKKKMKNLISNVNVSCKLTAHKGGNVNSRLSPCGLYGHSGGRGWGSFNNWGIERKSQSLYTQAVFLHWASP